MENHIAHGRVDAAWRFLKRYHPTDEELSQNPDFIDVLDMSKQTVRIHPRDWPEYIDSLTAVIIICRRRQWLETKQDRNGRTSFFCLRKSAVTGRR